MNTNILTPNDSSATAPLEWGEHAAFHQPRPLTVGELIAELATENPHRVVILNVQGSDGYLHAAELSEGNVGEPALELHCLQPFPG